MKNNYIKENDLEKKYIKNGNETIRYLYNLDKFIKYSENKILKKDIISILQKFLSKSYCNIINRSDKKYYDYIKSCICTELNKNYVLMIPCRYTNEQHLEISTQITKILNYLKFI